MKPKGWGKFNELARKLVAVPKEIVNDKAGKHLDCKEIHVYDFILELILLKIKTEFFKSKKEEKTSNKIQDLILKNINELTTRYEFENFFSVMIKDVKLLNEVRTTKIELREIFKDPEM